jgi:hypothetical protein
MEDIAKASKIKNTSTIAAALFDGCLNAENRVSNFYKRPSPNVLNKRVREF